jgi:hypothetical protein
VPTANAGAAANGDDLARSAGALDDAVDAQ